MARIDSDNMRDKGMELLEKRLGEGTHHDQPGKPGTQEAAENGLILELLLCLDDGYRSAETGEFVLNAAENARRCSKRCRWRLIASTAR